MILFQILPLSLVIWYRQAPNLSVTRVIALVRTSVQDLALKTGDPCGSSEADRAL